MFSKENWYNYLTVWQRQLVEVSSKLLKQFDSDGDDMIDYSFIVFPMAKAYEGFLKKLFLDFGLISQTTYDGRRFRIGRALNPDVSVHQRDKYWLFDDVARVCSQQVARQLWDAWLHCRNRVFHYFPKDQGIINLKEAQEKVEEINLAMRSAVACYQTQKR